MTLSEFIREIKSYYDRTDTQVINKIIDYMKSIEENEYDRIYNELLKTVPPARQVGVAQLHEVAIRLQARRTKVFDDRLPTQVNCPACNNKFRYLQGVGRMREDENIYEFCPVCQFPIHDYIVHQEYLSSNKNLYGIYIQNLIAEKRTELEKKRLVS